MQINYRNKMFWAWNGKMEESEIRQQIAGFAAVKAGGFFIHARGGLLTEYMSESWMEAVSIAIDEAKKQNLEVWLYDEDGWPSGFAGGKVPINGEEYCLKYLKVTDKIDKIDQKKFISAFKNGKYTTDKSVADKIYYYDVNVHYVDIFSEKAICAFIDNTHEQYYKHFACDFGGTIKAIFTDEPQYNGYIWSEDLSKRYYKDYLIRLEEDIINLNEVSDKGDAFRQRYYDTVCKLYEENYVARISHWCEKHGIMSTGHFPEEDGLSTQYLKGGDIMYNYRTMQCPAIDLLGRRLASPVLLKQISSVKNQMNRPYAASESFGCCGWNTSFGQYSWIWGYESSMGINLACLHLSAYTISGVRKRDYPAFFSYQAPWYGQFHYLNEWMERLNKFISIGNKVSDVMVISPLRSCYRLPIKSERSRQISNEFRILTESLNEEQITFDYGDEFILKECSKILNGRLNVGKCSYGIVIVADTDTLSQSTLNILIDFKRVGGEILFTNRYPMFVEGNKSAELDKFLNEFSSSAMGKIVQNRAALWGKVFESIKYKRLAMALTVVDGYRQKDVILNITEDEKNRYVTVFNKSVADTKEAVVAFNGNGTIFEFDLKNGTERNCTKFISESETATIKKLLPMSTSAYRFEKGNVKKIQNYIDNKADIFPLQIAERLTDKNFYQIDMARYRLKGEKFSESENVLFLQKKIYELSFKLNKQTEIEVEYVFKIIDKPQNLKLYIESKTSKQIKVNGCVVNTNNLDWLIDKSIMGVEITNQIKIGNNTVSIFYDCKPKVMLLDIDKVFETEKNRFYYDIEIEGIYLTGDFDVVAQDNVKCNQSYYTVEKGGFALSNQTKKNYLLDLTPQGMYFYRGGIEKTYSYKYDDSSWNVEVCLEGMRGVVAEIKINGNEVGALFCEYDRLNITDSLKQGDNIITITTISGNRNLLGPHHHYKGEQRFVGVNTFRGTRGYEDEVVDMCPPEITYTDSYSFVSFCSGKLKIIYIK